MVMREPGRYGRVVPHVTTLTQGVSHGIGRKALLALRWRNDASFRSTVAPRELWPRHLVMSILRKRRHRVSASAAPSIEIDKAARGVILRN